MRYEKGTSWIARCKEKRGARLFPIISTRCGGSPAFILSLKTSKVRLQ
jgi:hypothetical protein